MVAIFLSVQQVPFRYPANKIAPANRLYGDTFRLQPARTGDAHAPMPDIESPNQKNEYGVTPFHRAVVKGDLDVAQKMLERGANPELVDRYGCGTLHRAAMSGNPRMVRWVLALGLDPNQLDWSERNTPLHEAAICGNVEVIRILLKAGSSKVFVNHNGRKPYQLAAGEGHAEAAALLKPGLTGILLRCLYYSGLSWCQWIAKRLLGVYKTVGGRAGLKTCP
jgi:ankyrin repeat protein